MGINIDRGVEIRHSPHGVTVYMYVDQPGVFYNEHGAEIGAKAAAMAGFNTEALVKERLKREAIAKAGDIAAKGFTAVPTREIVATLGDFAIIQIAEGRFNVEYVPDGSVMNMAGPVDRKTADTILEALQPAPESAEPAATQPAEKPGKPAKA